MGYEARIEADSISQAGKRLTTFVVTFPRIVLAEFNTHRQFSRNSASSRATPVEKMIERVMTDPFIPARFPLNERGMQASEYLEPGTDAYEQASHTWLDARKAAVTQAKRLIALGIHKQIANRLLEPWLWHTVIVTATEWSNFFAQRCDKDAQPEIQTIAQMMRGLMESSQPKVMTGNDLHLPFVTIDERAAIQPSECIQLSVARCARVSYLNHDGKHSTAADVSLYEKLRKGTHMSPFEHVASPCNDPEIQSGNFVGWLQYRKMMPGECR